MEQKLLAGQLNNMQNLIHNLRAAYFHTATVFSQKHIEETYFK